MSELIDRAITAIADVELSGITHEDLVRRIFAAIRDPGKNAARIGAITLCRNTMQFSIVPADAEFMWQKMIDSA